MKCHSFHFHTESMKVKKTDLPVMPPEDILPSLDDEADESSMDDGMCIETFCCVCVWCIHVHLFTK